MLTGAWLSLSCSLSWPWLWYSQHTKLADCHGLWVVGIIAGTTKEFFTEKRHYTIIDAPGHMITGAFQTDCATFRADLRHSVDIIAAPYRKVSKWSVTFSHHVFCVFAQSSSQSHIDVCCVFHVCICIGDDCIQIKKQFVDATNEHGWVSCWLMSIQRWCESENVCAPIGLVSKNMEAIW